MMMSEYLGVDDTVETFLGGSLLDGVHVGTPSINLARIVCCFLLHLELLPELSSAKSMIDFARKNPSRFHNQNFEYAILFGFFKLIGGGLCISANLCAFFLSKRFDLFFLCLLLILCRL